MSFGGADAPAPTPSESTAARMQAFIDYYPQYLQTELAQAPAVTKSLIDQTRTMSPAMNDISLEQLQKYGPAFNKIGADISAQNAQAQAASDLAVLKGSGQDLLAAAKEAAMRQDPEYYATRTLTGDRVAGLLDSFGSDPYSLSGSERAQVERSLGGNLVNRGNLDTPSAMETLTAASGFGNAVQAKRDAMASALQAADAFMNVAKSGTDVFQVATGKPSSQNQGANKVGTAGGEGSVNTATGTGNTFMNGINQAADIGMQINANRRTSWDTLWQGLDHINNYIGTAGNIAGATM